jgi:hypothetical membrane protein
MQTILNKLPRISPRYAALAGIAAPLIFWSLIFTQEYLTPLPYDAVKITISELVLWPYGWIQTVNFIVFGVLVILAGIGLQHSIDPDPRARLIMLTYLA